MDIERRLSHTEQLTLTHENWLRDVQTVGREAAEVGRENTLNIRDLTAAVKGLAEHQKQQDEACEECKPVITQARHTQWAWKNVWVLLSALGITSAVGAWLMLTLFRGLNP
jgi:hypothetical protein